ncbi:MAG: hypothetical protein K2Q06_02245 [Parvularculaceae bacterium]|nr:hypothetical protein [Parvularculaceae bacterium]
MIRAGGATRFSKTVAGEALEGIETRLRHADGSERRIWAATPRRFASLLSERDDVFLPTLALYALICREDLGLDGVHVDPFFRRNIHGALLQYAAWNKRRAPRIEGAAEAPLVEAKTALATCFSGGVDSLFTLLRHSAQNRGDPDRSSALDVSYAMHLFYRSDEDSAADSLRPPVQFERLAASVGASFLPIYTNIYHFDDRQYRNYSLIGHGAAFASIGHMLSGGVGCLALPSSHTYGFLCPYGSTPELDSLYSSSALAVRNDGPLWTRVEKTAFICRSLEALAAINVCDKYAADIGYKNCSRCHKCLRTMTAIDLVGKANARDCPAFDWTHYSPRAYGRVHVKSGASAETDFSTELVEAARGVRPDIEKAALENIRRSRWLRPIEFAESTVKRFPLSGAMRRRLKQARTAVYSVLGASR